MLLLCMAQVFCNTCRQQLIQYVTTSQADAYSPSQTGFDIETLSLFQVLSLLEVGGKALIKWGCGLWLLRSIRAVRLCLRVMYTLR